jgi:hypothetical protein
VVEPEGKRPLGRPRRRWKDNIKCIIKKWTEFIWLRIGEVAGTCKCGNEPSGSIKCKEYLDQLINGQLLSNDSELKTCF